MSCEAPLGLNHYSVNFKLYYRTVAVVTRVDLRLLYRNVISDSPGVEYNHRKNIPLKIVSKIKEKQEYVDSWETHDI